MALIYTVPQNHAVVIERLGRFSRVQRDGIRFKIPFIERVRTVDGWGGIAKKTLACKLSYQNNKSTHHAGNAKPRIM